MSPGREKVIKKGTVAQVGQYSGTQTDGINSKVKLVPILEQDIKSIDENLCLLP